MTQGTTSEDDLLIALRALSNDRRLAILDWLESPRPHFHEQIDAIWADVCPQPQVRGRSQTNGVGAPDDRPGQ